MCIFITDLRSKYFSRINLNKMYCAVVLDPGTSLIVKIVLNRL